MEARDIFGRELKAGQTVAVALPGHSTRGFLLAKGQVLEVDVSRKDGPWIHVEYGHPWFNRRTIPSVKRTLPSKLAIVEPV